jgi:hypothetical protein
MPLDAFNTWAEKARAVPIEREIERRGIRLRGNGKSEHCGPCPKCGGDDRFSINTTKQLFHCRGCDVGGDVIKLVEHLDGVDFAHACQKLTGDPGPNGKRYFKALKHVVATFEYHDESGAIAYVIDRVEFQAGNGVFLLKNGKRKKEFRQRRPDPDRPGQWIHNVDGVPKIPYHLPELIEAVAAQHLIFIVEGEGKVDALREIGVVATCNPGGAGKWQPEFSERLRGADVILVPDNDDPGWKHVHQVGASLVGIAGRTRVLILPDLPEKGDVRDWLAAGGTREQLDALVETAPDWQPPAAKQVDERVAAEAIRLANLAPGEWKIWIGRSAERLGVPLIDLEDAVKTKVEEREAREKEQLEALAKMKPGVEFDRQRKKVAKEFGISRGAVDEEIKAFRSSERSTASLHEHWEVELWPEPVDSDALLQDIVARIRRHVICTYDDALAVALWAMFAWVHDKVAVHSPLLDITSAEPECGKSTMLGLLSFLLPRCISTVEVSEAALYRAIRLWQPSFAIDEFDTVLSATDDDNKGLRSVINSGHTRAQGVLRCQEKPDLTPVVFSTFAPKAIGMIGRKMTAATLGRCIIVELRRRKSEERIDRFKHEDDAGLGELRSRLLRWSTDNENTLRDANPSMPDGFDNRRADNWRVLFAIADLAGSEWGDKARLAGRTLENASDTSSIGIRLLADIKRIRDETA